MKKVCFLLAMVLMVSSGLNAYDPLDGVKAQKQEAQKYVKNYIDVKTLKQWISKEKDFEIVDVREQDEINAGAIDFIETINIPRGKLYTGVKSGKLKPNKVYVMVCRTGHRALLAASVLNRFYKFKNVYVLTGGIKSWVLDHGTLTNSLHLGSVKITLNPDN